MNATIAALNIYPVKSCRGIGVNRAAVTATGLRFDRNWLIVRPDGKFITQREEPRMATIETAISATSLELRAPAIAPLELSLAASGSPVQVTCWRDQCAAFDAGDEAARWLTSALGSPARLVRFDERKPRLSDLAWTKGIEAANQFTDGYPVLVISQASLDDLNLRLPSPLPMNRFRPNLVLHGIPPYAEDEIDELHIGAVRLRLVKPCTRCAITTTDQTTGARESDEPLRTLRRYRFSRDLKGVMFGQNAIVLSGEGQEVSVGAPVLMTWRSAPPAA